MIISTYGVGEGEKLGLTSGLTDGLTSGLTDGLGEGDGEPVGEAVGDTVGDTVAAGCTNLELASVTLEMITPERRNKNAETRTIVFESIKPPCLGKVHRTDPAHHKKCGDGNTAKRFMAASRVRLRHI